MVKAKFITGLNQREIALDLKVNADLRVGQVVTIAGDAVSAVSDGTTQPLDTHYIVAQSDMTMAITKNEQTHQFEYSDVVKQSATAKKVALFRVVDPTDVVYATV